MFDNEINDEDDNLDTIRVNDEDDDEDDTVLRDVNDDNIVEVECIDETDDYDMIIVFDE